MTTAPASLRRRRYLGSYFDELSALARSPAQRDRPASISVGSQSLSIESWEWEVLRDWARSPQHDGWRFLLAEGLALETRCIVDMEQAAGGLETARSDLHFDAVLGFKLMGELQRAVERVVTQGEMDQAKRLTQFRHRIHGSVSAIGGFVGDAALRQAEMLAATVPEPPGIPRSGTEEATDPTTDDTQVKALLELEEKLQKNFEREESRSSEAHVPREASFEGPGSTVSWRLLLLAALAVLTGVWFVLVVWPRATREPISVFTVSDFGNLPVIQEVVARPPSLFVILDEEKWSALGDQERQIVEKVAGHHRACRLHRRPLQGHDPWHSRPMVEERRPPPRRPRGTLDLVSSAASWNVAGVSGSGIAHFGPAAF